MDLTPEVGSGVDDDEEKQIEAIIQAGSSQTNGNYFSFLR